MSGRVVEKEVERLALMWVVLGFIFIQPLGMLLLGVRKIQNRKSILKEGQSLFKVAVVFLALFAFFIFALMDEEVTIGYGFYFFGSLSLIAFVMSGIMIRIGVSDAKYMSAVVDHELTKIDDIASAVKKPKEVVVKELKKLIRCDVYPNASLDTIEMVFCLDKYATPLKHMQAQTCTHCGATVVAVEGQSGICEYCGSAVNM